ncbi:hypothetical protein [Natrononativus amylolyticus]|uniref:hypothetical protein n=1 Tax=Natrononativus amylolyticus TaxID=2963434 RepID=UPI0020CCE250|nr:hypothetical protein [Natrononativus amylolyticus]
MSDSETRYDEGDVVATPDGTGVVAAVLAEDFEFPRGTDELTEVDASDDRPAYVVGLESVGSAVYRASALRSSSFDEETTVDGEALTELVDEEVDALDSLPEGWDRESVLEYWSSIGGSWESCVDDMSDEFEGERAKEHCSAMKDEVLRTERWRNRF